MQSVDETCGWPGCTRSGAGSISYLPGSGRHVHLCAEHALAARENVSEFRAAFDDPPEVEPLPPTD